MWTRIGLAAAAFASGAIMLSAMGPAGADPDACSAVTNLCEEAAPVEPGPVPELELAQESPNIGEGDYLDEGFRVIRDPHRHDLAPPPYGFFYAKVGESVWLVNSDTRQVARRAI